MISMTDGPLHALMQATVPAQMQGRVFALLGSLFSLTTPIGLALAGPLSDVFGIRIWFQTAGILCIVTATACLFIPTLIHIEDQRPSADGARDPVSVDSTTGDSPPRPGYEIATD
jgi:DHA3 family macrolide efflux protein-like MFS transporter